jgi:hypothetical protein
MSNPFTTMETGRGAQGLLSFAGARLLLAAGDLRMIEAASDVTRTDPPPRGIGWIAVLERWSPVYALSFDLEPVVDAAAAARPICVILGEGPHLFGLLCDDVGVARDARVAFSPLPRAMRGAGSPIRELAVDAAGLLCATDAGRLAHFIGTRIIHDNPDQA